jgi:hypothetical protein
MVVLDGSLLAGLAALVASVAAVIWSLRRSA